MRKESDFRRQFFAICDNGATPADQRAALELLLDKEELDTVLTSYGYYHPQGWTLYREACLLLTDAIPF